MSGKFRKQFRKVNNKENKKHPAYIYAKVGDDYKFLGITHAKLTKDMENVPLEKNPDPHDQRPAYIRPKADKANKSAFGKRLENWRFTNNDDKTANKLIEDNEKAAKKPSKKKT